MKTRWTFTIIRRRELERLERRLQRAQADEHKAIKASIRAADARDTTIADCAQLMQDLRLVRVHIERGYSIGGSGTTRFTVECPDELLFDGFARSGRFREAISYLLEIELLRNIPVRKEILTGRR